MFQFGFFHMIYIFLHENSIERDILSCDIALYISIDEEWYVTRLMYL